MFKRKPKVVRPAFLKVTVSGSGLIKRTINININQIDCFYGSIEKSVIQMGAKEFHVHMPISELRAAIEGRTVKSTKGPH